MPALAVADRPMQARPESSGGQSLRRNRIHGRGARRPRSALIGTLPQRTDPPDIHRSHIAELSAHCGAASPLACRHGLLGTDEPAHHSLKANNQGRLNALGRKGRIRPLRARRLVDAHAPGGCGRRCPWEPAVRRTGTWIPGASRQGSSAPPATSVIACHRQAGPTRRRIHNPAGEVVPVQEALPQVHGKVHLLALSGDLVVSLAVARLDGPAGTRFSHVLGHQAKRGEFFIVAEPAGRGLRPPATLPAPALPGPVAASPQPPARGAGTDRRGWGNPCLSVSGQRPTCALHTVDGCPQGRGRGGTKSLSQDQDGRAR